MSYTSFKNKWLGKRTNIDGAFGYQCVDVARQYMHEEFGLAGGGAWGNAIDYANKPVRQVLSKFDKVSGTPKQGDIVVFYGHSGNPYGHIGLVDRATSKSVLTLEQNGSTGNGSGTGGDAIRLRWIPRSRIAGLLRPKVNNKGDDNMVSTVKAWYKKWLRREADKGGLNHHVNRRSTELQFADGARKELHNKIDSLAKALASAKKQLKTAQNKKPEVVVKEVEKVVKEIEVVEKEVHVVDPTLHTKLDTILNVLRVLPAWIGRAVKKWSK